MLVILLKVYKLNDIEYLHNYTEKPSFKKNK